MGDFGFRNSHVNCMWRKSHPSVYIIDIQVEKESDHERTKCIAIVLFISCNKFQFCVAGTKTQPVQNTSLKNELLGNY